MEPTRRTVSCRRSLLRFCGGCCSISMQHRTGKSSEDIADDTAGASAAEEEEDLEGLGSFGVRC